MKLIFQEKLLSAEESGLNFQKVYKAYTFSDFFNDILGYCEDLDKLTGDYVISFSSFDMILKVIEKLETEYNNSEQPDLLFYKMRTHFNMTQKTINTGYQDPIELIGAFVFLGFTGKANKKLYGLNTDGNLYFSGYWNHKKKINITKRLKKISKTFIDFSDIKSRDSSYLYFNKDLTDSVLHNLNLEEVFSNFIFETNCLFQIRTESSCLTELIRSTGVNYTEINDYIITAPRQFEDRKNLKEFEKL